MPAHRRHRPRSDSNTRSGRGFTWPCCWCWTMCKKKRLKYLLDGVVLVVLPSTPTPAPHLPSFLHTPRTNDRATNANGRKQREKRAESETEGRAGGGQHWDRRVVSSEQAFVVSRQALRLACRSGGVSALRLALVDSSRPPPLNPLVRPTHGTLAMFHKRTLPCSPFFLRLSCVRCPILVPQQQRPAPVEKAPGGGEGGGW